MIGDLVTKRKTLISMLFVALTMLGYVSYRFLPQELFPNAELPFLIVQIYTFQDIDPANIEKEAVIPVEGAIETLGDIDKIESYASQRMGMVTVYYNQGVSLKYAYLKLEEKIDAIRSSLPENYTVRVVKIDTEQISNQFMTLQVRGEGGVDRVRSVVDEDITRELESIDGISNVDVSGGREKSVEIIMKDEICRAYGITPSRIASLIRQNSASNTYVGQVTGSGAKNFVNVTAEYTDIKDLENITVLQEGPVLLGDVADVYFGVKEQTSISRVNGKEAVTVNLVRDAQVNLIDLSHRTRKVIDSLNSRLKGSGVEIVIQTDSAETMEKNINLIIKLAIIGGLIAIAILWAFLRNLRLVLIIALAIPISVFTAFNFFYAAGISINSLTLIGMALAVGMLLDNSVVVLENIYRLVSKGKDADTAVMQGLSEVWRSIFAATLTTITVFLPFIFSSNYFIKLIGKHIGVSIISTLLISLAVALLLVPMVTHFFLKRRGPAPAGVFQSVSSRNRLLEIYNVLIKSCLRFPLRTIIATVVVFFASVMICLGLSLNVSHEAEATSFTVYITMPKGSTLDTSDLAVADAEARLETIPEKQDIISDIREDEASITVRLKDGYTKIGNRTIADIKEDARKKMRGFVAGNVSFDPPQSSRRFRGGGRGMERSFERMFGIGSQQESIVIKGSDIDAMSRFAESVKYFLDDLSTISTTGMNIDSSSPELHLLFDTRLMSYNGISLASVAAELASFPQEYESRATFKQGTEDYAIVIKNGDEEERSIADLEQLPVQSSSGGSVELQDISRMIYSQGMPSIRRVNQEKQIDITYQFTSAVNSSRDLLDAARQEVDQLVAGLVIPPGMAVEVVHEENDYGEFKFLIAAAFILIYIILASVFESLTTPLVMMFTIPLAAIGSFWLLIFTGTSLISAYTLTGFLILLGVVVNNGIILIDYSLILRRRGYRRSRALIMAGQARTRPILITAITTIAAMVPLAMGKSEEVSLIGAPFAITVIGGLSLSTLFTLIFIPVVYSGLESAIEWIRGLDWRIKTAQLAAFIGGTWLIYARVSGTLWKMAFLAILVFSIPGLTWFIMSSLRTASTRLIPDGEPIRIRIRNLGKTYDRPSRFMREWRKGNRIRARRAGGSQDTPASGALPSDPGNLVWQVPLLAFMIYFVYFYLSSALWVFILLHPVYFYILFLSKHYGRLVEGLISGGKDAARVWRKSALAAARAFEKVFIWGFPLLNLVFFFMRWHSITAVVFAALFWYLSLVVFTTADRLNRDQVNIARLSGRFSGIRRAFYYLIRSIPLVGTRRRPFRALAGVSIEIGRGMFGLLGPNGAGKTTLMRIICGILDQSFGKIDINGIDINEKREELQGLIGYLPQEFGTYENMTAWEFLNYQAMLKGLTGRAEREKMVEYVLGAVHIEENRDQLIGSFSGGMKQRVGIAQILLHLPRILVVDEPTAGLDPRERIRFRNLLVELSRERVVIFSTHIIEDIYSSCNKVAVLDHGRLLYVDEPSRMTGQAEGKVWVFKVRPADLERIRGEMMVVHHMRDGEMIRVRCLNANQPHPEAQAVRPTLEDAYLWLLKNKGAGTEEA